MRAVLVFYLLLDAARNKHLARLGDPLDLDGNVDAIAVDVVRFNDDVAEIDADPVLDPGMVRHRCISADHVLLDDNAAPDGFDRAIEGRNESVAGGFDEPAVVLENARLYQIALDPSDARMRSFLV